MSEGTDDTRPTQTEVPRITMEGRRFGNMSYVAEKNARMDDLRRLVTRVTAEVLAPRASGEHRDTGARRRDTGA